MDTKFEINDILKRLHAIENSLLQMTGVIDLDRDLPKYEKRLKQLECLVKNPTKRKLKMEPQEQTRLEQEAMIKKALIEKSFVMYHQLIQFLRKLPIDQHALRAAYEQFAHGILWVKDVMEASPLNLIQPPQPDMPSMPSESIPEDQKEYPQDTTQGTQCELSCEPVETPTDSPEIQS